MANEYYKKLILLAHNRIEKNKQNAHGVIGHISTLTDSINHFYALEKLKDNNLPVVSIGQHVNGQFELFDRIDVLSDGALAEFESKQGKEIIVRFALVGEFVDIPHMMIRLDEAHYVSMWAKIGDDGHMYYRLLDDNWTRQHEKMVAELIIKIEQVVGFVA